MIDLSYTKSSSAQAGIVTKVRKLKGTPERNTYNNAVVLPYKNSDQHLGGVVTEDGNFLDNTSLYEERKVGPYEFESSEVLYENKTVIYLGLLLSVYGHAITDNLKKIWVFQNKDIVYDEIVYIANWAQGSIPSYIIRLFNLSGLDITKCKQISTVTKFKAVIVPANSFVHHNKEKYYYEIFNDVIHTIQKNISCKQSFGEKLYFARTGIKQSWHRDWGEKSIERVFRSLGYQIIRPETLSIDQQISAMLHCTHFASTEGSVAHNSIFCKPGTMVILIKKCNIFNPWQLAINDMSRLNVTYVDAHKSIKTNRQFPMVGPFYMCITKELEQFSGRRFLHLPLWLSPSWYMYKYQIENKCLYQKFIRMLK